MRRVLLLAALTGLAGCQTQGATNWQWQRIGYGPTLEVAEAQCRIGAMGMQQGVIAWGSPGYVAGAQLGNAIGNAIRTEQFMKDCMTIKGWKKVPLNSPSQQGAATAASRAQASSQPRGTKACRTPTGTIYVALDKTCPKT